METKISQLRRAATAGNWTEALRIAARFPSLGDQAATIVRAHEAGHNPRFYRQIGKDPDAAVQAGIAALKDRYGL